VPSSPLHSSVDEYYVSVSVLLSHTLSQLVGNTSIVVVPSSTCTAICAIPRAATGSYIDQRTFIITTLGTFSRLVLFCRSSQCTTTAQRSRIIVVSLSSCIVSGSATVARDWQPVIHHHITLVRTRKTKEPTSGCFVGRLGKPANFSLASESRLDTTVAS